LRTLTLLLTLALPTLAHALPPTFHVPGEGTLDAKPGGRPLDVYGTVSYGPGQVGQAALLPAGAYATWPTRGLLDKAEGSVCLWLRPNWNGNDGQAHAILADVSDYQNPAHNTLMFWKDASGYLRLDLRSPQASTVLLDVRDWQAGEWRHVAATWDARGELALYVDGLCRVRRTVRYEPRNWPLFNLGADWAGRATVDAALDEIVIYPMALDSHQVLAVKQGWPLEEAALQNVKTPRRVLVGQPFPVTLQGLAPQALTRDYSVQVMLGGMDLGTYPTTPPTSGWAPGKPVNLAPLALTLPEYLRLPSGKLKLTLRLAGAVGAAAETEVQVIAPTSGVWGQVYEVGRGGIPVRNGRRFIPLGKDEGVLHEGRFYTDNEEGRAAVRALIESGRAAEALPVRLLDTVDCSRREHGLVEWGRCLVRELTPGVHYRVTGPRATVTQKVVTATGEKPALPAFAYTVATTPEPVPHLLVVEMPNDRERYTEIALDAAPGSALAPHLADSGPGETRLINLVTTYTGREYGCDGKPFRQSILFYPKSAASEVTISSSGRELQPDAESGAAVSRIWVYQMLDLGPATYNVVAVPERQPQRSVGVLVPQHEQLLSQYGFSGQGAAQRRASLLTFIDTLKFMGLDRIEFQPLAFGPQSYYDEGRLPNMAGYDLFSELLPLGESEGLKLVPTLDALTYYEALPEFTDESFQLDRSGQTRQHSLGRVPDPLRPEVQSQIMTFLSEFLEKVRGSTCVPALAVRLHGQLGTCYVNSGAAHPPFAAGYDESLLARFQQDTGLKIGGTPGDAASRYAWLRANPEAWERWLQSRCDKTRDLWLRCRDLVVSRGSSRDLLLKTLLPGEAPGRDDYWTESNHTPREVLRHHGFDPALYEAEKGLRVSGAYLVGSDRYYGQEGNKTFAYNERLIGVYGSAEGSEIEVAHTNWELPDHPRGFRVGPATGPGRAFFEPLTHALRTGDPYAITFTNWQVATAGHELDLRRFVRAYRALPAIPGEAFEGKVWPQNERLVARWHGRRLAVINDTPQPRKVRITFPKLFRMGTQITELGSGRVLSQFAGKTETRVEFEVQAWDLATLDVVEMPSSSLR
jgi:hypothetical protein